MAAEAAQVDVDSEEAAVWVAVAVECLADNLEARKEVLQDPQQ